MIIPSFEIEKIPISNSKDYLILFVLWPFFSFIIALANYSQKEAKRVVYFFLVYYGLTFVIGNVGVDAEGYVLRVADIAQRPFSDFFKIVGGLYSSETSVDIIEPFISFLISRFTTYHGVLFAVWASIFGFFYLRSFNLLYNKYQKDPDINSRIFMIFFALIIPITTINGVRMFTAAWIFFYGAYYVIINRDAKYLLLSFGASLLHFTFLPASVVLIVYYLLGNRNKLYLPITIASFFLPQLFAPIIETISYKMGGAIQNRYEGYTSEGYLAANQELMNQASWFIEIGNKWVFYYLIFALILIQIITKDKKKEQAIANLYSFILLFIAFVNFGSVIPSFGGRFQKIFYLFGTLYLFLFFNKSSVRKIHFLSWLGLFPLLVYVAIQFRMGSESINMFLFTPGFGLPLLGVSKSLAELFFY